MTLIYIYIYIYIFFKLIIEFVTPINDSKDSMIGL